MEHEMIKIVFCKNKRPGMIPCENGGFFRIKARYFQAKMWMNQPWFEADRADTIRKRVAQIATDFHSGERYAAIAKKHGCCVMTVKHILDELGLKRFPGWNMKQGKG